ncbi:hypothetical protein Sjap_012024 [Stephania japonica]|uniref:Uncharacterized protein n=1 Tax=Stephania japonica TaxID=461633 RepID=A0AAP0JEM3_9MAGN
MFVIDRSRKLNRRLEEMTNVSPDVPVDEDEIFYEVSGRDEKGHARSRQGKRGDTTSQVDEVLRLNKEVTILREEQRRHDETMHHLLAFMRQQHPEVVFCDPEASISHASPHQTPPSNASPLRGTTDHDDYRDDDIKGYFAEEGGSDDDDLDRL